MLCSFFVKRGCKESTCQWHLGGAQWKENPLWLSFQVFKPSWFCFIHFLVKKLVTFIIKEVWDEWKQKWVHHMNSMLILIYITLLAYHCCWFNQYILGWHKVICPVSETSMEWVFDMFCYFSLLFVLLFLPVGVRRASLEALWFNNNSVRSLPV